MSGSVKSLNGKPRLLSPKSKSKEPFQGQLIVLDNASTVTQMQQIKSSQIEKAVKRPPSGSLEVLKSEKERTASPILQSKQSEAKRPDSGRKEKLPGIKRKEESSCEDQTVSNLCLDMKMQHLSIQGKEVRTDLRMRSSKVENIPTGKTSFTANPANIVLSANVNGDDDDDVSSEDSESDQDGGGSENNPQPVLQGGVTKAPLELLGRFLSAVMGKNYTVARSLCNEILEIEPSNATCLEFKRTLEEKLHQDDAESSCESDDDDDDEDESEESSEEEGDSSGEEEHSEDDDSDEEFDVSKLNLLLGGIAIRK